MLKGFVNSTGVLTSQLFQHIADIPYENQLTIETRGVDNGTVTHLEKIKFLQNNLLAAHTVWVNDKEVYISFLPYSLIYLSLLNLCFLFEFVSG